MEEIIKNLDENLKVLNYKYEGDTLIIDVETMDHVVYCPNCKEEVTKVHSRYNRKFKDLPIQEYKVIINMRAKKFFCKNNGCYIITFTEEFDFIEPRSRMTKRLEEKIVNDSKNMSARALKGVLNNGIVDISDDTILRKQKKSPKN